MGLGALCARPLWPCYVGALPPAGAEVGHAEELVGLSAEAVAEARAAAGSVARIADPAARAGGCAAELLGLRRPGNLVECGPQTLLTFPPLADVTPAAVALPPRKAPPPTRAPPPPPSVLLGGSAPAPLGPLPPAAPAATVAPAPSLGGPPRTFGVPLGPAPMGALCARPSLRELVTFLVDNWRAGQWAEAARRRVALRAVPVADLAAPFGRSARRTGRLRCGRCRKAAWWAKVLASGAVVQDQAARCLPARTAGPWGVLV